MFNRLKMQCGRPIFLNNNISRYLPKDLNESLSDTPATRSDCTLNLLVGLLSSKNNSVNSTVTNTY